MAESSNQELQTTRTRGSSTLVREETPAQEDPLGTDDLHLPIASRKDEAKKDALQGAGRVPELPPFGQTALLRIMHQHHHATLWAQEQTDKAKKDALQSAARVSELLVKTVNGGVEECFLNEKQIEIEIRAMINNISHYTKQTNQWLSASHAFNTALKEIGDFENWMKVMEHDCKNINKALLNIYQP